MPTPMTEPRTTIATHRLGGFGELHRDRSSFQRVFLGRLLEEPGLRGRVLDIGAGPKLPRCLEPLGPVVGQLDGVDPNPAVRDHPGLTERWASTLEEADIPAGAYDLAYAYNVAEHVAEPVAFFRAVRRALKPGAAFWALTPHRGHPFCTLVRATEHLRLKERIAARNEGVNAYPSYYRLNSPAQVLRAIRGMGFSTAHFEYLPCVQWDQYFPSWLRWAPHLYDRAAGSRMGRAMLIVMYRLEVGE